jgi:iron complex transport system substrate-binding protein
MNRKKRVLKFVFLGLVFTIFLLLGCSGAQKELAETDAAGRQVVLESPPQRIVSLAPSITEMLYALELGDRVFGVTDYCNYPEQAKSKEKVGGFADIVVEKVLALQPDLVLAANLHISKTVPALEKLDLKVFIIDPQTIDQILEVMKKLGKITGTAAKAKSLNAEFQSKLASVEKAAADLAKVKVFWELSNDLWTAGPGSFVDDLIQKAGGINTAANTDSAWVQLSNETIIEQDPGVIILADHPFGESKETVAQRVGWDIISAVKKGRIIEITPEQTDIISRPGPRFIQALDLVYQALHP